MVLITSDLEQRYAYLLQPIRDLTKNWNIDITSELENYLSEIESIAITFDNGKTTLNFAEAALLIQGSACVYSRKVEYLHSLVYQVLDLIVNRKKQRQEVAGTDADDHDATSLGKVGDEDYEFLSLDDIQDVSKKIDIDTTRDLSRKPAAVLPKISLSLMPLTDGEKGENPLLSKKGEILGSRNDFRMNTCKIHPSGMLLLDMSHLELLELSMANKPCSTPFIPRRPVDVDKSTDDPDDPMVNEAPPQDISLGDDDDAGFEPVDMEIPAPAEEIIQTDAQQIRRSERNKNLILRPPGKLNSDPWKSFDPHQPSATQKAFCKKKTYKLTKALLPDKKRKRKSSLDIGKERLASLNDFCIKAFYSRETQFPKNPLKIPSYIDFEELYWAEYKLRQQRLKKDRQIMKLQGRVQDLAEEIAEEEDDDHFAPLGVDEDAEVEDVQRVDLQIPVDLDLQPIPDFLDQPGNAEYDDEDPPIVSSYEELMRRHVEGYLAGAQQYAQITELSRRVTEWEEKIIPKLEEAENHGPFDIHKYGSAVIKALQKEVEKPKQFKMTFKKFCSGKPQYEVCRLFLSTLQLANNYNVEISVDGTLDEAIDTMSLKLLSTKLHFEDIEGYVAPSVQ